MKKFEEEVKRPSNAGIDPFSKRDVSFEKLSSKFTKGAQTLKEWKEYAFKAEDRIRELESQLEKQQPEIPEVPLFVAEWLDRKPLYAINGSIPVEIIGWSKKQTGYADLGMNINHLLKLKVNGYTVEVPKTIVTPCPVCGFEDVESNFCGICGHKNEYVDVAKEKRFYLKHKSVLIFDPDSDDSDVEELYLGAGGNFVPYKHLAKIFTQSQIDSMETGSYEQIEVEEEV